MVTHAQNIKMTFKIDLERLWSDENHHSIDVELVYRQRESGSQTVA